MPLRLKLPREATILTATLGLLALARYLDYRDDTPITPDTLRNPRAAAGNPLDALAYRQPDPAAATLADAGLYGGPTLPLLLAFHPRPRQDYPKILLLWRETIGLTFALTSVIKNAASRPRPYVLNPDFDRHAVLTRNDRAAFLSGHAALATAGATLFARLVERYDRNYRLPAWGIAGIVAGGTGFLRVRAAKHWPTDAVAGVLLGFGVAEGLWQLHFRRPENSETNA